MENEVDDEMQAKELGIKSIEHVQAMLCSKKQGRYSQKELVTR